jgi:hypothetical protein
MSNISNEDDLTVHFASRIDQIHFMLYAMVDLGPGKHEQDLRAMEPTEAELLQAAMWSRTHDPSEGYRTVLESAGDLAAARVLGRDPGPARYRIDPDRWFRLLYDGGTIIDYRPWPEYLSAYRKLLRWLWAISESDLSTYLVSNSAAQLPDQLAPRDVTGEGD